MLSLRLICMYAVAQQVFGVIAVLVLSQDLTSTRGCVFCMGDSYCKIVMERAACASKADITHQARTGHLRSSKLVSRLYIMAKHADA